MGESLHSLNLGFLSCPFFPLSNHILKILNLKGEGEGLLIPPLLKSPEFFIQISLSLSISTFQFLSLSYMSNICVSTSSEMVLPLNLGMRKDPEWYPGFLLHLLCFRALASLGMSLSSLWALSLVHAACRARDWHLGNTAGFPEDHEKAIREPQRGLSGQILFWNCRYKRNSGVFVVLRFTVPTTIEW